jgi:Pyridoxamine 5'-phosphate oxidase
VAGFIQWRNVNLRLRSRGSIWVATTRPDGRPAAVPGWDDWDAATLRFVTGRTTQKARNGAPRPWVVVRTWDGDDLAMPDVPAEVVTDRQEPARVDVAYRDGPQQQERGRGPCRRASPKRNKATRAPVSGGSETRSCSFLPAYQALGVGLATVDDPDAGAVRAEAAEAD